MSDRELLIFAAKAAGLEYKAENYAEQGEFPHGWGMVTNLNGFWNPLTDDGDALRLAVKLNLLRGYIYEDEVSLSPSEHGIIEPCNGDPYSATRRAIVRAAAEIGKAMP